MHFIDIVIAIILAVLLFFALRRSRKELENGCGGCHGANCAHCPLGRTQNTPSCPPSKNKKP